MCPSSHSAHISFHSLKLKPSILGKHFVTAESSMETLFKRRTSALLFLCLGLSLLGQGTGVKWFPRVEPPVFHVDPIQMSLSVSSSCSKLVSKRLTQAEQSVSGCKKSVFTFLSFFCVLLLQCTLAGQNLEICRSFHKL